MHLAHLLLTRCFLMSHFFLSVPDTLCSFTIRLCRPLEVFSEARELVQFALSGGKQFLEQIPASALGIC